MGQDGWQARLTQMEDFKVGSLSSGQVRLTVTGDLDRSVDALTPRAEAVSRRRLIRSRRAASAHESGSGELSVRALAILARGPTSGPCRHGR